VKFACAMLDVAEASESARAEKMSNRIPIVGKWNSPEFPPLGEFWRIPLRPNPRPQILLTRQKKWDSKKCSVSFFR
jgi:hypothetical protein